MKSLDEGDLDAVGMVKWQHLLGAPGLGQGQTIGRLAELLMKSAIPNEGPIRTSWPALRNLRCATEVQ